MYCLSSAFGLKEWVDKLKIPTAFTFVLSKFPSAIFILTVALLSTVGRVGVFFTQTDTTSSYVVGKCKSGVFFQANSVFAPRASS